MLNFTVMKSKYVVILSTIFKCFPICFEKKIIFCGLSFLGVILILKRKNLEIFVFCGKMFYFFRRYSFFPEVNVKSLYCPGDSHKLSYIKPRR